MLIKIFKTNHFLQLILIFFVPVILWVPSFINPIPISNSDFISPLYSLIYNILNNTPLFSVIIAFVLIVCEGFLLNYIFTSNGLIPKTTLLPAFIYILLMSCDNSIHTMNTSILVNLFLLLSFKLLLQGVESKDGLGNIFMSCLYISVAALFYLPAIVYWLLVMVAFVVYKIYYWREWFVSILGLIAPFILIFTYYFLNDVIILEVGILSKSILTLPNTLFSLHSHNIPYYIYLCLFCIMAIFSIYKSMNEHVIFFRKKCYIVLYYLLFAIVLFMYTGFFQLGFNFFAIPFSLIISMFLFGKQKRNFYNIVLLIFIVFTFINVYIR